MAELPAGLTRQRVALNYFKLVSEDKWECQKCGVTRKANKNKSYENLFSHVKQKRTDFADQINSSSSKLDFTIPEKKPIWLARLSYHDW